jgi:serine/threonine-protein kinase SRPK3
MDQQPLESGMPQYLVKPTSYPIDVKSSFKSIKIVDFGQSFLSHDSPSALRTPLPVRAPEIIFKDRLDCRVDLWSMGCIVSLAPGTQRSGKH